MPPIPIPSFLPAAPLTRPAPRHIAHGLRACSACSATGKPLADEGAVDISVAISSPSASPSASRAAASTPSPSPRRYASARAESAPVIPCARDLRFDALVERLSGIDIDYEPCPGDMAHSQGRSQRDVLRKGVLGSPSVDSDGDDVVFVGEVQEDREIIDLVSSSSESELEPIPPVNVLGSVDHQGSTRTVPEVEPTGCGPASPLAAIQTPAPKKKSAPRRRRGAASKDAPRCGLRGEEVWLHKPWRELQQTATRSMSYSFARVRESAAKAMLQYFDDEVLAGVLRGRVEVVWNRRLLKTAGLTYMRREGNPRSARIELSVKVVDDVERLYSTMAHELCHACQWILDDAARPPHGKEFKRWARVFQNWDEDLSITTCHEYAIAFRFEYTCQNCGYVYGRHSRSIDTSRQRCGKCSGRLVLRAKKAAEVRAEVSARSASTS